MSLVRRFAAWLHTAAELSNRSYRSGLSKSNADLAHIGMVVRMENWKSGLNGRTDKLFRCKRKSSLEVVAVSGLVSTPEKWNAFNGDWNECLSVHGVSALHMKHFSQFRGEFSSWDEPHRRRFLNGLLWIVENQLDYTSGCAVAMRDYNAADAKYMLSECMRPYTLASLTCAAEIVKWVENSGQDRGSIIYVFEKGDIDQSDLRAKWEKLYPSLRVPQFQEEDRLLPRS